MDTLKGKFPEIEEFFQSKMNGGDWLSGIDKPTLIDFVCFPMCDLIMSIEHSAWHFAFKYLGMKENLPRDVSPVVRLQFRSDNKPYRQ